MSLDKKVIKDFVAAVNKKEETKTPTILTGTVHREGGTVSVKIDGSESLTPVSTVINVEDGERVTLTIENHKAMITGNLSSPAARTKEVEGLKKVVTDKVDTAQLKAIKAEVGEISGDVANFKETTTEKLTAQDAKIKKIDGDVASFKETTTEKFKANEASIEDLKTGKLSAKDADLKYANIDFSNIGKTTMEYFYAQSGLIKDVTIGDATITGELVGVTISGNLIKGNTIVAEKLVIKGSDGLYYKLNTDGMTVEKEQTDYNSLNGQVIRAKSITATKIDVEDLVAFGATIGGFKIGQDSIYSGVKESVGNTTRGIYMDNDGQFVFGDASQYVKFYRVSEGKYKLAIAVEDLFIGSKSVAESIEDVKKTADNAASVASSASSAASTANSTANAAKSTAEGASKSASDAKSTADSASQVASNAAKTATNYMKFDNSGLTVGDLTKNTLGRNVNIDSSSVNIRNGSNVLASFAESLIEIGKNTNTATISFLNGIVKLIGQKQTIEGTTFHDAHLLSTDMMTIGTGSTDPSSDKVNALISLNGMSGEREVLASVTDTQGHSTLTVRDSSASLYSDGDAGYSSVNVITNKSTSQVEIHTNGSNGNRALINYSHAIQYYNNSTLLAAYNGKTPCLWDGFQYPMESTPVTLSAPISTQPHGVLLMFALWNDQTGSGTNNFCASYFIPKTCLNYWHYVPVFWQDMWRCGTKTIYVEDTQIKGHSHNYQQGTGATTNIKYTSSWFVLRRVYGI